MIEYMLFTVHWQSVTDWRHNSYKSLQVNKPCTNFPLKKARDQDRIHNIIYISHFN